MLHDSFFVMQAHPVIKMKGFKRSNVVSKMAGTMGRALVTPLTIAAGKPGSGKAQVVVSCYIITI